MSETTEPATIKDLVERFRKFSFRSETYPIKRGGNFVYQFDAAEIAPQQSLILSCVGELKGRRGRKYMPTINKAACVNFGQDTVLLFTLLIGSASFYDHRIRYDDGVTNTSL
ncbi:hypothetical protein OXX80_004324 [Metschnikowia pulcherrima]